MSEPENKNAVVRFYEEVLCGRNYDLAYDLHAADYLSHPSRAGEVPSLSCRPCNEVSTRPFPT